MTTTINRRTALLGTVTLPAALAPAAVLANGTLTSHPDAAESENDPFVSAFCRYVDAEAAYLRACKQAGWSESDEDEKRANARCDAAADAMLEMGETVPTTTLGLYLGICALLPVFGEFKAGGNHDIFSFDDMIVRGNHTNGCDEALLRSLRTAADRILNNNHPEDV